MAKQRAHKTPRPTLESSEEDPTSNSSPSPPPPPPKKTKLNTQSSSRKGKEKLISDSDTNIVFRDAQAKKSYAQYLKFKILQVRPVPLDAHPHQIVDIIARQGWQRFMRPEVPCYPRIVREFYANLEIDLQLETITTIVQGHTIVINPKVLNDFYGFTLGSSLSTKKIEEREWEDIKLTLKWDATKDPPRYSLNPNHIHKLSSCGNLAKLLARLLQENIIQIGFHKSDWSIDHILAVYHLLKGRTLNTSNLIMTVISNHLSPRAKCLPFGNSICELLHLHFNLNLSNEAPGPSTYRFTPQALQFDEDDHIPSQASPSSLYRTQASQASSSQIHKRLEAIEGNISKLQKAVNLLTSIVTKISSKIDKIVTACVKPGEEPPPGDHESDEDPPRRAGKAPI